MCFIPFNVLSFLGDMQHVGANQQHVQQTRLCRHLRKGYPPTPGGELGEASAGSLRLTG